MEGHWLRDGWPGLHGLFALSIHHNTPHHGFHCPTIQDSLFIILYIRSDGKDTGDIWAGLSLFFVSRQGGSFIRCTYFGIAFMGPGVGVWRFSSKDLARQGMVMVAGGLVSYLACDVTQLDNSLVLMGSLGWRF